jgi:hypothetical protein
MGRVAPKIAQRSGRRRRGIMNAPAKTALCSTCGHGFTPRRSTARYCRDACRKAAQRNRDRGLPDRAPIEHPDWYNGFEHDPEEAARVRVRLLRELAANRHSPVVPVRLPCGGRRRRLSLGTGPLGVLTACWVRAELDERMRLNNWSIAASYDTARIFAGLGFGSSTASRSIISRPRRRGDRISGTPCCACSRPLMAQSGHSEWSARLSAFGAKRTCGRLVPVVSGAEADHVRQADDPS